MFIDKNRGAVKEAVKKAVKKAVKEAVKYSKVFQFIK